MKTVLIQIDRGMAETIRKPNDVNLEIVDLDRLREGDCEDIRRYWLDELSPIGRKHIRQHFRELFQALKTAVL